MAARNPQCSGTMRVAKSECSEEVRLSFTVPCHHAATVHPRGSRVPTVLRGCCRQRARGPAPQSPRSRPCPHRSATSPPRLEGCSRSARGSRLPPHPKREPPRVDHHGGEKDGGAADSLGLRRCRAGVAIAARRQPCSHRARPPAPHQRRTHQLPDGQTRRRTDGQSKAAASSRLTSFCRVGSSRSEPEIGEYAVHRMPWLWQ